MKKHILIIATLLIATTSLARHVRSFSLRYGHPRMLTNSLYKQLKVLDLRKDENIGYIKTGAFNNTAPLVTDKPLPELLSEHFSNLLAADPAKGDDLVFALYDFKIEEPIYGEIGTFYIDGDFYGGNGVSGYHFLGSVDSFFEVSSGIDVTTQVINTADLVTTRIMVNYSEMTAKPGDTTIFTKVQIPEKRKNDNLKYPIYKTGTFKRGIYYGVNDFINHTPIDTPLIGIASAIGDEQHISFYYEKPDGRKGEKLDCETFFAIYDGTDWAASNGKYCVKMTYTDGNFYAIQTSAGLQDPHAGHNFGVIGSAIGARHAKHLNYRSRFDPRKKRFGPFKRLN